MTKYPELRKAFKVSVEKQTKIMELEGKETFSHREGVKPRNKKTQSLISARTTWAENVKGTIAAIDGLISSMLKENKSNKKSEVNSTFLTKAFVRLEEERKVAKLEEADSLSA